MSRAVIFGCAGPRLSPEETKFFKDADPWAFILFGRNLENADQIRALCADLRTTIGWHAPVFIDQEGGRVARLAPPLARRWLPALDMVTDRDVSTASRMMWIRSRLIALDLLTQGIDGNCAPVADVARDETHTIMQNRCYGRDPDFVAKVARAGAKGHLAGGVLPVLKHLPGYGRATLDSHFALPLVSASLEELETTDFAAFHALSDLPLGMTAHIRMDALDPELPATLSPIVMKYVRQDIGFGGLLMTDDLSMQALPGTLGDRTRATIEAGVDIALHCNGDLGEMSDVLGEVPELSDQSLVRADRALDARQPPIDIDIEGLEAEFETLSQASPSHAGPNPI